MTSRVELIDCEGGNYSVLIVDGVIFHEGSSIPDFMWLELLTTIGVNVFTKTISDKDMEDGYY